MDAPLVPSEVDLKDFPFTPIFRARLFGSEFHAAVSDAAWRGGVTLWLKSWDQVPAGSLPKDDAALCRLAELGRDIKAWRKIASEALHGWLECSDGRLYHRVVAEGVLDAWQRKCAQRDRTARARAARLSQRLSQNIESGDNGSVTEVVTDNVTESKGQGQGQGQKEKETEAGEAVPLARAPPGRATGGYAFDGAVVKLTEKDFENWRKSYWAIPDLRAELETIDAKFVDEGHEGKWFGKVSAWLKSRHERLAKAGANAGGAGFGAPGFA